MFAEPVALTPEEKMEALRALDIFHPWEALDEKRLCVRCGQIISGHEIKVFGGKRGEGPLRLECPTEGCASVPIEWLMLDPAAESPPAQMPHSAPPPPLSPSGDLHRPRLRYHPVFGSLRGAPLLV